MLSIVSPFERGIEFKRDDYLHRLEFGCVPAYLQYVEGSCKTPMLQHGDVWTFLKRLCSLITNKTTEYGV